MNEQENPRLLMQNSLVVAMTTATTTATTTTSSLMRCFDSKRCAATEDRNDVRPQNDNGSFCLHDL